MLEIPESLNSGADQIVLLAFNADYYSLIQINCRFFFVKEYIGTGLENIKYRFILILLTDLFMFLVHRLILTLNTLNQNTVKFISSLRVIQKIGREKQVLFKGLETPW